MLASFASAGLVLAYTDVMPAPRQAASIADPVLGGGPGCAPSRSGHLVRGNGTGSLNSGPDVILAFQHAYYVARSGTLARGLTTPDAAVPAVADIDASIASVPAGTRHCVLVIPLPDGQYDVVVTEMRPDATYRTHRQFVTVVTRGGESIISTITPPN
ncbi:hypothetical protein ACL02S_11855 [Nocardia sp. 004]|uniref:hypothetical protein n=1 Tax=Nocardia sp. 004 TaxID=3385978 RepID=UPI00399FECDB